MCRSGLEIVLAAVPRRFRKRGLSGAPGQDIGFGGVGGGGDGGGPKMNCDFGYRRCLATLTS